MKSIKILLISLFCVFCVSSPAKPVYTEAKLIKVSKLPQPTQIDYPNCNFTAEAELSLAGQKKKTVILVFRGIVDRQSALASRHKVGDSLKLKLIPASELSETEKQTQIVDDILNFDLDVFYAFENTEPNSASSTTVKQEFIKNYDVLVRNELQRIEHLFAHEKLTIAQAKNKYKPEFEKLCRENLSFSADGGCVGIGTFEQDSMKELDFEYNASVLSSIIDIKKITDKNNIPLVVIPVPTGAELAMAINEPFNQVSIPNKARYHLIRDLLKRNILVFDALPIFVKSISGHQIHNTLSSGYIDGSGNYYGDPHLTVMGNFLLFKEVLEKTGLLPKNGPTPDIRMDCNTLYPVMSFFCNEKLPKTINMVCLPKHPKFLSNDVFLISGDSFAVHGAPGNVIGMLTGVRTEARAGHSQLIFSQTAAEHHISNYKVCFLIFCASYITRIWQDADCVKMLQLAQNDANKTVISQWDKLLDYTKPCRIENGVLLYRFSGNQTHTVSLALKIPPIKVKESLFVRVNIGRPKNLNLNINGKHLAYASTWPHGIDDIFFLKIPAKDLTEIMKIEFTTTDETLLIRNIELICD